MWVVYDKETTKYMPRKKYLVGYGTEAAAKAALTKAAKAGLVDAEKYEIADYAFFKKNIEKTVVRESLMTGAPITITINTPACCDPSTETYWSF